MLRLLIYMFRIFIHTSWYNTPVVALVRKQLQQFFGWTSSWYKVSYLFNYSLINKHIFIIAFLNLKLSLTDSSPTDTTTNTSSLLASTTLKCIYHIKSTFILAVQVCYTVKKIHKMFLKIQFTFGNNISLQCIIMFYATRRREKALTHGVLLT